MLYSFKNIDLENSNELVSLEGQVKAKRSQDMLGEQNFHEDMKKVFEPVAKSIEDVSEEVTKTMTETSIQKNRALENLNDKLLEIMNDRGMIPSFLLSPLSKIINPENTSQFRLVKNPNSNTVNDLLIHNTIPVTLYNSLLTFHDTDKKIELQGDLLKMTTKKNCNVDIANSHDGKIMYDFAKEMYFDVKARSNKITRDR